MPHEARVHRERLRHRRLHVPQGRDVHGDGFDVAVGGRGELRCAEDRRHQWRPAGGLARVCDGLFILEGLGHNANGRSLVMTPEY